MSHSYAPTDASHCLTSRHVIFTGDLATKSLFIQFAKLVDPTYNIPHQNTTAREDLIIFPRSAAQLSFFWDPYLNSTRTRSFISIKVGNRSPLDRFSYRNLRRPALLVLGSGVQHARHAGSISVWEANLQSTLESFAASAVPPSDQTVILPVEDARTIEGVRAADVDAMNSDLYHRLRATAPHSLSPHAIIFPSNFKDMYSPSSGSENISDVALEAQANLLLNIRCNNRLDRSTPTTCCRKYPSPMWLQAILLISAMICGPGFWFCKCEFAYLLSTSRHGSDFRRASRHYS